MTAYPNSEWKQAFRRRLRKWYRTHARELPWRQTHEPYRIWVSEIMLQQTQVATVIPYYERFLESFPDVVTLANANEESVLRHWEGLGYYRRAKQLHKAAKIIRDECDGEFPHQLDAIEQLPGIGRYTAGAIASFAFDQQAPIVEANTARLYSRLTEMEIPTSSREGQLQLWEFAEAVLPRKSPGEFNQALIEIGSQICHPRSPNCEACPVVQLCPTFSAGKQDSIPIPKTKIEFTDQTEVAVVVRREDRLALRMCQPGERWAGLWDFPRFQWEEKDMTNGSIKAQLLQRTGIQVESLDPLKSIKHGVTRYRIQLHSFIADYATGELSNDYKWHALSDLESLPLNTTARKIAALVVGAS